MILSIDISYTERCLEIFLYSFYAYLYFLTTIWQAYFFKNNFAPRRVIESFDVFPSSKKTHLQMRFSSLIITKEGKVRKGLKYDLSLSSFHSFIHCRNSYCTISIKTFYGKQQKRNLANKQKKNYWTYLGVHRITGILEARLGEASARSAPENQKKVQQIIHKK